MKAEGERMKFVFILLPSSFALAVFMTALLGKSHVFSTNGCDCTPIEV